MWAAVSATPSRPIIAPPMVSSQARERLGEDSLLNLRLQESQCWDRPPTTHPNH